MGIFLHTYQVLFYTGWHFFLVINVTNRLAEPLQFIRSEQVSSTIKIQISTITKETYLEFQMPDF